MQLSSGLHSYPHAGPEFLGAHNQSRRLEEPCERSLGGSKQFSPRET
jgi:hypothetical protein